MHAAKRRTLIFNSSLLVCRITLRSPFLYFNVMIPLLILSKSKNYAALAAPHKAKVSMQWEAHGRSALRPIVSIRPASERAPIIGKVLNWSAPDQLARPPMRA